MRHVCETEKGMVTEIKSEIRMNGDLDEEQRKRLLEIAVRVLSEKSADCDRPCTGDRSPGSPKRASHGSAERSQTCASNSIRQGA